MERVHQMYFEISKNEYLMYVSKNTKIYMRV